MATCISVIGPAMGQTNALNQAISVALKDDSVRQVIYLGEDNAAHVVVEQLLADGLTPTNFLTRAVDVAVGGSDQQIRQLLNDEACGRRLAAVRCLPKPPARAIELLDRWILLAVHDKAVLDEDDIANAQVILYGKSDTPMLKRFGQRYFFSPGPLSGGHIGALELKNDGSLVLALKDLAGNVEQKETLLSGASKLTVTA